MRRVYYLMRRYFKLSVAEVDALPWHHSRLYLEGLVEEASGEEQSPNGAHHPVGVGGEATIDELGAIGLTVREA